MKITASLVSPSRLVFEEPEGFTSKLQKLSTDALQGLRSFSQEILNGNQEKRREVTEQLCRGALDELEFQAMKELAKKDIADFFDKLTPTFLCHPEAKDMLIQAAKLVPFAALMRIDRYAKEPYAKEVIAIAADAQPASALRLADRYIREPYAQEIIMQAAKADPHSAMSFFDRYAKEPYAQMIITRAIEQDPVSAWRVNAMSYVAQAATTPAITKLQELSRMGVDPDIGLLLDELVRGTLTVDQATVLAKDDTKLLPILIRIKARPNHLGSFGIEKEIKDISLQSIQLFNTLHEVSDRQRFEGVANADSKTLFTLMTYGEEEIWTSSFNGCFDRLLARMQTEHLTGDQLICQLGFNKFRTFIKMCAGFGRLGEFLKTMPGEFQKDLLRQFVTGIETASNPLEQAVVVADTFASLSDPALLTVLSDGIRAEYARVSGVSNQQGIALYGLLAGMFAEKRVIDDTWSREMAERYQLKNPTHIDNKELLNPDGTNVQQYFFYNDEDGAFSFKSFLGQYQGKPGWKVTNDPKSTYVTIESTNGAKKVSIYANKPEQEDQGPDDIAKALQAKNIQSIVVVHRGHSYHTQKTIDRIPFIAKIVSLGSCGGYNNLEAVLRRAPDAHILSTKGTGTMTVNDPVLRALNDMITAGKDIDWPQFWQQMEKRLGGNKDFGNYVPPHKNLGAMFVKAYRQQTAP